MLGMWLVLPLSFFAFSFGLSALKPFFFTPYLPFLSILAAGACVRFKKVGWVASLVAFTFLIIWSFNRFTQEERMWQLGLLATIYLDLLILTLMAEELSHFVSKFKQDLSLQKQEAQSEKLAFEETSQAWEQQRLALEKELEKLKSEAELRKIEKRSLEEQLELVQSEITLLTSQKEAVLEEARALRVQQPQPLNLVLPVEESSALAQEEEIQCLRQGIARAEGLYGQLRAQFAEKSEVLSETRKALFHAEERLAAKEKELADERFAPPSHLEKEYEAYLAQSSTQLEELEAEIKHLEELVSRSLNQ